MTSMNSVGCYDLIIIGAGPAGLAAGFRASQLGLEYVILERGLLAQTVYDYPIGKPLFSTPNEVELIPGTLKPKDGKPTREEVLTYYNRFALRSHRLNVRLHEPVREVVPVPSGFRVETEKGEYVGRFVLAATGGFGIPRKLNVPGETEDRVSYRFTEAYPYAGQTVLVVGGGNSAGEAVIYLHEGGADVVWSLRRPTIGPRPTDKEKIGIKPWVREPLEALEAQGEIRVAYSSKVREITPDGVVLAVGDDGETRQVPAKHVFALLGADPDTALLRGVGAEIAADGRPAYDPTTYETTVPGLFVVGHLTREMHMKNAVAVPPHIVDHLASLVIGR